ncbi:hypothetical protein HG66A1_07410 [Gimesia chilikensis]|uniref:Uncharacterized protein n=2 Tax=Gimesia chilikensis TaxID=2605989 RepID=A0A517PHW7_9PLAN|nr:hypothetical protein HG66A1_07410 [Gimesia chilikensis]
MIVPADSRHERRQVYFRCVPFLVAIALMTVRFPPEVFAAPLPQSDPFESEVSPQFSEIREAIDEDDYEQALRLLTEKRVIAVKVKNQFLLQEILAEIKEVNRLKREFSKVREKAETLKTKPGDPEANEKVGLFYCAEKGDWIAGLNMLSKSGDSGLRQAALDDLKQPETPAHRMKLADAWWEQAEKEKDQIRKAFLLRGRYWYLSARPGLTELERFERDKQLEQIVLEADKIVVWNMHGSTLDHGTDECVLTLFLKGKAVWRQKVVVPWKAKAPAGQIVYPPRVRFDQIRVDITKYRGFGGGLGEIEVFDGTINVARNCSAVASSYWRSNRNHHPDLITDGDKSGLTGIWLLNDGQKGWVLVDMKKYLQQP